MPIVKPNWWRLAKLKAIKRGSNTDVIEPALPSRQRITSRQSMRWRTQVYQQAVPVGSKQKEAHRSAPL
jgi:hypothetical protein